MNYFSTKRAFEKYWNYLSVSLLVCSVLIQPVSTQTIEADYNFVGALNVVLINGIPSTPIRFIYRDFSNVDRLFCKYTNSTNPFVAFGDLGTNSRVLAPISPDYSVINATVGISGYFGLRITGRVDRDDGKNIICQYSTQYTIGSSSIIRLNVVSPPIIETFQTPVAPVVGESVQVGCTITGYPYPTVEIIPPRNQNYETKQLNPSTTKLTKYKYLMYIKSIDNTWINERLYCSALLNNGKTLENYVSIRLGYINGQHGLSATMIAAITLGVVVTLAIITLLSVCFVNSYRAKQKRRGLRNRYAARGIEVENKTDSAQDDENAEYDVATGRRHEHSAPNANYVVSTAAFV